MSVALLGGVGSLSLKELSLFCSQFCPPLFYQPISTPPNSSRAKNENLRVRFSHRLGKCEILTFLAVARFNNDTVAPRAVPPTDGEKSSLDKSDMEKQSESRQEDVSVDLVSPVGDAQEEHFEWREVLRGMSCFGWRKFTLIWFKILRCCRSSNLAHWVCLFWLHC